MGWKIRRYPEFRDDLRRWHSSDASLSEELIKKCRAIEENPLKGEPKWGGPIADHKSAHSKKAQLGYRPPRIFISSGNIRFDIDNAIVS